MEVIMQLSEKVYKYLDASYKYYIQYTDTGMTDYEYDMLCKWLYSNYDSLTEEEQMMVNKDSLMAGTGYDIKLNTYKQAGIV